MKWKIETRKISTLTPHAKNPRKLSKHDEEHLQKSLQKFGLIDKPVIAQDGRIIGGHQRLKILKKLGHKEIECFVPDQELTEKDIDELCIRLNRATGEWDFDLLKDWEMNELMEWGFTPEELTENMPDIEIIDPIEPDNEVLEPPKDPKTKLGDVYELGDHRLVCGDSTNGDTVRIALDGNEPILMVTDPPYGVEYDPMWRKGIKGKHGVAARAMGTVQNDDQVNWALAWALFLGQVAYIWCASWFLPDVAKDLDDAQFERKSLIIWVKQHFALSRGDYHWQHEPCWYAVRKGQNHNWQGARDQATVWEISNLNAFGKNQEDERTAHSTQKPLECMARPIRNNTAEGEGVYDPFLGSGTTLLAAEQLNRKCFGIELDPAYCDIVVDRWVKYRNKCGKDAIVKLNNQPIEW
jgi:DNA modification methylase